MACGWQELFYVGLDNRIMAVPIQLPATGEPTIGAPSALFTARFRTVLGVDPQQYEVSGDGQRFRSGWPWTKRPRPSPSS